MEPQHAKTDSAREQKRQWGERETWLESLLFQCVLARSRALKQDTWVPCCDEDRNIADPMSPVARSWRLFHAMYEVLAVNQRQQCNDALSHAPAFSKLSADHIRV